MNTLVYALFSTAAVVSLTACGGGVSHDAAPTGQSVAPIASSASASPCSSATADVLEAVMKRQYGGPKEAFSGPFTVYDVRCAGDWVFARVHHENFDPNTNPPSMVLFGGGGGGWRVANYGSGFDCTDDGVPPSIAKEIECGP